MNDIKFTDTNINYLIMEIKKIRYLLILKEFQKYNQLNFNEENENLLREYKI